MWARRWWHTLLSQHSGGGGRWVSEVKARLDYRRSSRIARHTQRTTVSNNNNKRIRREQRQLLGDLAVMMGTVQSWTTSGYHQCHSLPLQYQHWLTNANSYMAQIPSEHGDRHFILTVVSQIKCARNPKWCLVSSNFGSYSCQRFKKKKSSS